MMCPLRGHCQARRTGCENQLPVRADRPNPERVEKQLLIIEQRGRILVWRRADGSKRLAGFWELPEGEQVTSAEILEKVASFRHTIVNTNYMVHVFRASVRRAPPGFRWKSSRNLDEMPLSTTARKALARHFRK